MHSEQFHALPIMKQTEQQRILDLEKQLKKEKKAHEETKTMYEAALREKQFLIHDLNAELIEQQYLHKKDQNVNVTKFSEIEKKLEHVTRDLCDYKKENSKKIDGLKAHIIERPNYELIEENKKLKAKIVILEKRLKIKDGEIKESQKKADNAEGRAREMLQKLISLKASHKEAMNEKDQNINLLRMTIDEDEEQQKFLNRELKNCRTCIDNLTEKIIQQSRKIKELKRRVGSIQNDLEEYEF